MPRRRAVAAEQRLANELAHALVLDAVRLDIREGEEVGDPLHGHEIEEAHVPGDDPAVEPEHGRKQGGAMHVLGMAGGKQQRQHGARGQAADDDGVAGLAHLEQGLLGARVPILPAGGLDVLLGAAVAGELRAIDGVAGPRHAIGHVAHLRRRAAETVDQQHAHPVAADEVAVVLLNRHARLVFPLASRPDTRAIAHAAPLPRHRSEGQDVASLDGWPGAQKLAADQAPTPVARKDPVARPVACSAFAPH